MVTTRNGGSSSLSELTHKRMIDILKMFGRNDILLSRTTESLDPLSRINNITISTAVITGDLQFVTYEDRALLDMGIAKVGDGIFYTMYDVSINVRDNITVDSVDWELSKKIEAETLGTVLSYQAWIAIRRPS